MAYAEYAKRLHWERELNGGDGSELDEARKRLDAVPSSAERIESQPPRC